MLICASYLVPAEKPFQQRVDAYYLQQLQHFKDALIDFKKTSLGKKPLSLLLKQFYACRISYKKVAVITEYFNIYETKFLNAAAINRIEEDYPDKIITPEGLQAVEQLLFAGWSAKSFPALNMLLDKMQASVIRLEHETDRSNKFRTELVWDDIRSAAVRLITTGITGFDSPSALYSLPEAAATLQSMQGLLQLYKEELGTSSGVSVILLLGELVKAEAYLAGHKDFNQFDRLEFITHYLNPFYKDLVRTRVAAGIGIPSGNSPLNYNAQSLFAADIFNIDFYSPGNGYGVTPERIALGRKLFSDPILSGTNSRSCASCHQPSKAFTDGLVIPRGLDTTVSLLRNTPTLWNSALQTKQFLDSRADILENQLDEVVHNDNEMRGSLKKSTLRLKESDTYNQLFESAYKDLKDPLTPFTIANAISSYLRSLISLDSRFDRYVRGTGELLSPAEKNGFNLFMGKAKCATCHFIPVFNGLVPPVYTETESEILGVPQKKNKKGAVLDPDLGKFNFTKSVIHKYAFKTPTLRNIELTAPYMHNGVYSTLEEVVEFYNNGGGKGLKIAPPNQSLPFDRLNLSKKEAEDVIKFMKTLTDTVSLNGRQGI